jgi:hypothetical protein
MKRSLSTSVILAMIALFAFAGPAAADTVCRGTIGAVSIDDNVIVPSGASCTLDRTRVDGNVLVGPNARLTTNSARIEGNIQDDNNRAGQVTIRRTFVGGNVQLEQGAGATITDSNIDGDLQWESNRSAFRAEYNEIGGNLQANQNTGGLTISSNWIDGNLQCQSNNPAPTGRGNIVKGSAEGQCSNLDDPDALFVDVPSVSTHAGAIAWLVDQGITQGCTDIRYCPDQAVTRAQMATFLDRALGLPDGPASGFTDVPASSTHATGINAIVQAGITQGCTSTRYCPERPVTRGQMATFLDRALDLPDGPASGFTDVPAGSTHATGINAIVQAGITQGCSATSYCPDQPVTRAQMASFLQRALQVR